jgi:hypothetical protein
VKFDACELRGVIQVQNTGFAAPFRKGCVFLLYAAHMINKISEKSKKFQSSQETKTAAIRKSAAWVLPD